MMLSQQQLTSQGMSLLRSWADTSPQTGMQCWGPATASSCHMARCCGVSASCKSRLVVGCEHGQECVDLFDEVRTIFGTVLLVTWSCKLEQLQLIACSISRAQALANLQQACRCIAYCCLQSRGIEDSGQVKDNEQVAEGSEISPHESTHRSSWRSIRSTKLASSKNGCLITSTYHLCMMDWLQNQSLAHLHCM